jgi:hypothetical protein
MVDEQDSSYFDSIESNKQPRSYLRRRSSVPLYHTTVNWCIFNIMSSTGANDPSRATNQARLPGPAAPRAFTREQNHNYSAEDRLAILNEIDRRRLTLVAAAIEKGVGESTLKR